MRMKNGLLLGTSQLNSPLMQLLARPDTASTAG